MRNIYNHDTITFFVVNLTSHFLREMLRTAFFYDAMGNRVSKTVIYSNLIDGVKEVATYYVRDAQGNVMAVYEKKLYNNGKEDFTLQEQHLYGSSRLGMRQTNLLLAKTGENKEFDLAKSGRVLGEKLFELSNHLGNVLAVVSDKKIHNNDNTYSADVVSATDYYPFGGQMPGMVKNSESYRYGFQNQEKQTEITGTPSHYSAEFWMYDSRIGRRWNLDPRPITGISNYATFGNNPLLFIDENGDSIRYVSAQKGLIKATEKLINNGIGMSNVAKIDKNGDLKIKNLTSKELSKLTQEQQKFYFVMQEVESSKDYKAEVTVVSNVDNSEVFFGSYDSKKLDIEDFKILPEKGVFSKYSVFAHEAVEQFDKQKSGYGTVEENTPGFVASHTMGLGAERRITGFSRYNEEELSDGKNYMSIFYYQNRQNSNQKMKVTIFENIENQKMNLKVEEIK